MTTLDRWLGGAVRAGLLGFAALTGVPSAGAAESPPAPYWSVHLDAATSDAAAIATLKVLADEPAARAEKRKSGWLIRIGAWVDRAPADQALARHRAKFPGARVLQIENPVAWLLASGETVQPPAGHGRAAAAAADTVAPTTPAPRPKGVDDAQFKAEAQRLDVEVRRWLEAGAARSDGYVYGMDVAPLLLYAALRKDAALYERVHGLASPLIVSADRNPTDGFVLWRHKPGTEPEVSGATEALWLGRALWAGHRVLKRDADRAAALRVVEGYARHAQGSGGGWHVSKYYAFGTQSFAGLSVLPNYHPDFIEETEPHASGTAKGLARRSYGLLQRAMTPSKLLVPVIQPGLAGVLPGLSLSLYAPNGLVSLEDSCAAADGALRGVPQLAKNVLQFASGPARRDATGRLYAYYDRKDGRPLGTQVLSTPGYACLARIAVATKDRATTSAVKSALLGDLTALAGAPQEQSAPLYSAGPLLLALDALGAL